VAWKALWENIVMRIPFISRQFKGSYIGGILETYQRSGIFISAVQFLVVIIILYTTSAQPFIERYIPWLSFTLYMLVVIVGIMILMTLVKLLVIPSAYTFLNQQMWKNNNPMRAKLEKLEKNQNAIMGKLGLTSDDRAPEE